MMAVAGDDEFNGVPMRGESAKIDGHCKLYIKTVNIIHRK